MIYYTGDIHGSAKGIVAFAQHYELTESDIIVILGDVGANYYGNRRDRYCKDVLARIKPTVFCIHGNHERRPDTLAGYKQKEWNGGLVWYEDEYPNLLFARDGNIFTMEGTRHLVIGGAYSVDKYYRLENDLLWFADEQPSAEIKTYVEDQITKNRIDIVLSHTCPYKYEPRDAFLPMIDQSTVDDSTERWLDGIEEKVDYKAWLCGHWHIEKQIDKCALPGFVDSKNEEKTERNAGYLVVSHSGGGMLRQGTRKGIRRTPANRGMRAHWVVKGLDISEDVCHGMCP